MGAFVSRRRRAHGEFHPVLDCASLKQLQCMTNRKCFFRQKQDEYGTDLSYCRKRRWWEGRPGRVEVPLPLGPAAQAHKAPGYGDPVGDNIASTLAKQRAFQTRRIKPTRRAPDRQIGS